LTLFQRGKIEGFFLIIGYDFFTTLVGWKDSYPVETGVIVESFVCLLAAVAVFLLGYLLYRLVRQPKENQPKTQQEIEADAQREARVKAMREKLYPTAPAEPYLMEAVGVNGSLQLFENKVKIIRRGFLAFASQGLKGDKEIMIHQISSLQMKMPGFVNGYLQIAFLGGQENKAGVFDATNDENTIMFSASQQASFIQIKKEIENKIVAQRQPQMIVSASSGADEIEKLASLRDKGIITDSEFQAKKRQLLGL
jgi:hypothetical protein